jgi:hypothetical protein
MSFLQNNHSNFDLDLEGRRQEGMTRIQDVWQVCLAVVRPRGLEPPGDTSENSESIHTLLLLQVCSYALWPLFDILALLYPEKLHAHSCLVS